MLFSDDGPVKLIDLGVAGQCRVIDHTDPRMVWFENDAVDHRPVRYPAAVMKPGVEMQADFGEDEGQPSIGNETRSGQVGQGDRFTALEPPTKLLFMGRGLPVTGALPAGG